MSSPAELRERRNFQIFLRVLVEELYPVLRRRFVKRAVGNGYGETRRLAAF